MKTKTYRHHADYATNYKKIPVNYFLHGKATFLYISLGLLSLITLNAELGKYGFTSTLSSEDIGKTAPEEEVL